MTSGILGFLGLIAGVALLLYLAFFVPPSFWQPFLGWPREAKGALVLALLCIPVTLGYLGMRLGGGR